MEMSREYREFEWMEFSVATGVIHGGRSISDLSLPSLLIFLQGFGLHPSLFLDRIPDHSSRRVRTIRNPLNAYVAPAWVIQFGLDSRLDELAA